MINTLEVQFLFDLVYRCFFQQLSDAVRLATLMYKCQLKA